MNHNCLVCHQNDIYASYQCRRCLQGVCQPCGRQIERDIQSLASVTSCQFCTDDWRRFCERCQTLLEWMTILYRDLQAKSSTFYAGQNVDIELIQEARGLSHCRCDRRCKCLTKIRHHIKTQYGLEDFSLWPSWNNVDHWVTLWCNQCLKELGRPFVNEGYLAFQQRREHPKF